MAGILMPAAGHERTPMAVFDLDRTITRHGTWLPFLDFVMRRRGMRRLWLPMGARLVAACMATRADRRAMKEAALGVVLAGMRRPELERLASAYAEQVAVENIRPGALRVIERHRRLGHRLVLATASLDLYAAKIARCLGFDAVIATPAAWTGDDRLAPRLGGPNCHGRHKLAALLAGLGEEHDGSSVAAYSDHVSDLPMLEWSEFPVAVNPGGKLRNAARALGMPIEDWNKREIFSTTVPGSSGAGKLIT